MVKNNMQQEPETLYVEFDNNLYRIGGISFPTLITEPARPAVSGLGDLGSGSYSGNMEIAGGYMQSANFKTGVSGWKLTPVSGEINFPITFGGDYIETGGAAADINSGATTIDGGKITAGSIDTAQLDATAINGMTITGALIRTSSSGGRVVMDDTTDSLMVYDTGGNKRMVLDNDELTFNNASEVLMGTLKAQSNYLSIETASGASLGLVFFHNASQICAITSAGLNLNTDILAAGAGINIGSSSQPIEDIFVDDLRLTSQTGNPSANGMLRYYNNGGVEGIRTQLGGFDFQLDATGV